MDKKSLREMIRREVQEELYAILPKLLKEALSSTLAKQFVFSSKKKTTVDAPKRFNSKTLAEMIGYGDMNSSTKMIAGVPVPGGLREFEESMGVSHLNDVPLTADDESNIEEFTPKVAGTVPDSIVKALGSRAKQVLDESARRKNWRPGLKK